MQEIKTLMVPVSLTDEEKIQIGQNLTEKLMRLRELEDQRKEAVQKFKMQIMGEAAEVQHLTDMLHNGTEDRPVKCEVVYHMPVMGMKTIMRLDTNEPFEERDMTAADKKRAEELITQQTNDL